jgi:PPOX class probable F420-dependent enzyme
MSEPTPSRRHAGSSVLSEPLVNELVEARLVGVLSTYDSAGYIHSVPMWYARIEGAVILGTSSQSRKLRNLERDPRATLVLHDSRPGYEICGASITGTVEIIRGARAEPLVALVHERYLAPEALADPMVGGFLASDDVVLRLEPTSALTWDERGSDAAHVVRERGWALPLVSTDPRF